MGLHLVHLLNKARQRESRSEVMAVQLMRLKDEAEQREGRSQS